jgi:DNA-binding transcriptional ArsR family regulator
VKIHDLTFPPGEEHLEQTTELFRALSDPTRVSLLLALRTGERTVSDLVEALGKPQSTVSRHLAALRNAELVESRRDAARVWYAITSTHVLQLLADAFSHADHVVGRIPHRHER